MRVTMSQLAQRLGLSVGTISRALANDPAIAAATRDRVARTAQELGYEPNSAARALTTGRTRIISIHIDNFSSFFIEMSLRLQAIVARDGYMPVVHALGARMPGWRPDAEIILSEVLPEETWPGIPRVGSGPHPRHDYVGMDLRTPTTAAVRHLAAGGRRRIALLDAADALTCAGDRPTGYRKGMALAGLPPLLVPLSEATRAAARTSVATYLADQPLPEALVCHNDDTAIGALRALLDRGVRVPEDCEVIGCDGAEIGGFVQPPLSTIVQPLDARADYYWRFLRERLAQPDRPQQRIMLEAQLVLRGTTRPIPPPSGHR